MSYLPPEWEDEERVRVLMSPIPVKDMIALNSRLTFWKSALHTWANLRKGLSFTLIDACNDFKCGTQVPLCLHQVFQHLVQTGDIITYKSLLNTSEESWFQWSKRILLMDPFKWTLNMLQNTSEKEKLETEVFIDWKVLQEKGNELLSLYWEASKDSLEFDPDGLLSVEELFQLSSGKMDITLEDFQIILQNLRKRKDIITQEYNEQTLVKIMKPGHTNALNISETEIGEYQLRKTVKLLERRIKEMEEKADVLKEKAKQCLGKSLKSQALSYLRMNNRCKASLKITVSSLENLTKCLHHIQESKLNLEVLSSFETGINALKSSVAKTGGIGKVTDKLDTLQELLDECNEISDSLAFGISGDDVQDESELESELNQLEIERLMPPDSTFNSNIEEQFLPEVPQNIPVGIASYSPSPLKMEM